MLTRLSVAGYRSVRNLPVAIAPVTVFVGANGSGKTNLYRALRLLAEATAGRLSRALADEGRTMLVVTHEMEFAREVASQAIFLHQGLIEEQGLPREVLVKPRSERLRQFLSGGLK